jgi:DNA-binding HxlR family transcriptional regulator
MKLAVTGIMRYPDGNLVSFAGWLSMPLKRRRNSAPPTLCPLSDCMSLLQGAWTPNIIWYLSQGPRRFSELKAGIDKVSAKVLTQRLRDLEAKGVVTRHVEPTSPPSVEYALSDLGSELFPVIAAIVDVGHRLKRRRGVVVLAANRKVHGSHAAAGMKAH